MEDRILYSKRFDEKEWMKKIEKKIAGEQFPLCNDVMSADEFIQKVKEAVYIPVPERMKWKDFFVQEAIRLAEDEEADADVIERRYGIEVKFRYELIAYIARLMKLLVMADEVTVLAVPETESQLEITAVYYTHDEIFAGRNIRELRRLPLRGLPPVNQAKMNSGEEQGNGGKGIFHFDQ